MNSIQDKVVLITGSSRGIGRTTAIEMARRGARVVINGINPDHLQNAKDHMESLGFECLAIQADVTDYEMCRRMIDQVISVYNRLDILITNAGLVMESVFEDITPGAFKMVLDSHLYGTFFPIKASMSHIEKVKGSIILISSLAGLYGMPGYSAYSTGKMALTAFWQSLRLEKRGTGIHFGLLHLCFVKNDIDKTLIDADGKKVTMPPRPSNLQQPQEKVAKQIISMIQRRKNRQILSLYGKVYAFFARFSYPIINYWLNYHFRN